MEPHTGTGEWQSFEGRMRRKRAARLALRAEAAAEAGCLEEAEQCLVEARALDPGLPELAHVQAVLTRAESAVHVPAESAVHIPAESAVHVPTEEARDIENPSQELPPPSALRRRILYSSAAAVAVLALLALIALPRKLPAHAASPAPVIPQRVETAAAMPPSAPPPAVPPPVTEPGMPNPSAMLTPYDTALRETVRAPDAVPARVDGPVPEPKVAGTSGASDRSAETAAPRPAAVVSEEPARPATLPGNTLPPASPPAPPPPAAPSLEVSAPNVVTPNLSAPEPAIIEPAAIEPPQDALVRATLSRYAAAYSDLDVEAAARVWPGVNRGALARAFDGLSAQRVSLGDCRIDVTGATAQARCAGSATWTPKVGSGTHTESRSWTFELARQSGDWRIVSARVQNK